MTMLEWVFGGFGVASFVVAIWQYYENKYTQKVNELRNKENERLTKQNQEIMKEIREDTSQTFKQKDMIKMLPALMGATQKTEPKITKDIEEVKKELNELKKDYPKNKSAVGKINEIDKKIERTIEKTKDSAEKYFDFYLTTIYTESDLKNRIDFFKWLKQDFRTFYKEVNKDKNEITGGERIYYVAYEFPDSPFAFVPMLEGHLPLLKIKGKKAKLSRMGEIVLEKMQEVEYNLKNRKKTIK